MSDELIIKEVCDIKMCNLKDILVSHETKFDQQDNRFIQTETRLKTLEEYNIQAKVDSAILKQNQAEQKALTLELDQRQREKNEREFEKIYKEFEKNEINTDKKFNIQTIANKAQFDTQNVLLGKIIEGQTAKGASKLAFYGVVLVAVISLIGQLVEHFWK